MVPIMRSTEDVPKWYPGASRPKKSNVLWVNYESVDTTVTATAFQNLGSDPGLCWRTRASATGSYAAWPWIEPLIHWRPHSNNASCMPLQGTTKPSPFEWLAILSKNELKCTKQLLCRVNIMSKQKTSSVIMNVLWVYYEWDLPKHLMHFWCAGAIGSFFYYELCGKWLWVNRAS